MDDADRAGDNTDKFESDAIRFIASASKQRALLPVGVCHYCGEPLANPNYIFCDSECSADWHHVEARRKANGC